MIALALRNWKLLGIGAFVLGVGLYVLLLKGSLAASESRATKWQREAIERGQMLETQNAAIAELQRLSEQRRKSAARMLAEARKANAGTPSQVAKLLQSASTPSARACVISETLSATKGL